MDVDVVSRTHVKRNANQPWNFIVLDGGFLLTQKETKTKQHKEHGACVLCVCSVCVCVLCDIVCCACPYPLIFKRPVANV